ncbi:unnamed protein product, partial [Schistosoma intercalatum]
SCKRPTRRGKSTRQELTTEVQGANNETSTSPAVEVITEDDVSQLTFFAIKVIMKKVPRFVFRSSVILFRFHMILLCLNAVLKQVDVIMS